MTPPALPRGILARLWSALAANGRLLRLAVIGAAGLILLAQALTMALLTSRAERAALAAAEEAVGRAAQAVETALNRSFLQVDSMLLGLPVLLAPFLRDGALEVEGASRMLRELNNQNFTYRDVLLLGSEGGAPLATALATSRWRPPPLLPGPAYADAGLPGGGLRIGGPVRNPLTGEWSVFFLRTLELPGLGPVHALADVPVSVLVGLLGAGGQLPGLRVELATRGGRLLAALPLDVDRLDRGDGPVPEGEALRATRPTLYPLLGVTAELDRAAALSDWQKEARRALLVSVGFAVLVLALAGALLLVLRQRDRTEAERQRWKATLEAALDSMTDGFVMFDAADRLVICNRRYRELYALSAPFIREGAHFDDIIRGGIANGQYPQCTGDPEAFLAELRAWRRSAAEPIERLLPDGRWILITERRTPDGGTVGIRTDITALKRAMQQAEAAAEAKGRFLARMSHELRTPLNAILGFAQLLLSEAELAPAQREQLRLLHEAGEHLRELVNGLLDLAKIDAGRLEIEEAPVALAPLLERCVGFLAPEARRKGIVLRLACAEDLPPAILGDATRLRQMLLNLLSNGVKFTPPGGQVSLEARRVAGGLRLAVQDSGPGVPEEKRHLLFTDFTQLGAPADPDSPGTGLGLAITARLAERMGGRVGMESPPGAGATFWIELPLRPAPRPEAPAPERAEGVLPPLRLLVADDVPANRLLLRAMLTPSGHEVVFASDGAEALALLQRERFDAALLDVRMPVMDGLEATRRLRALPPPLGRLPVIAVTASALPEEVAECRAAGMDAHLAKPIERAALLDLLRRVVTAARPGEEGPFAALGPAAGPVMGAFVAEIEEVARSLGRAPSDEEQVRALLHRALGAAATLEASALVATVREAQAALRAGAPPAEPAAAVRRAIEDALPGLRTALAGLAPAPA